MPDVALVQSGSNNGTTSPATPGSLTFTNHNTGVLITAVIGTNPVVNNPGGGWTIVQRTSGASVSFSMMIFPNIPAGARNPSGTIGGTVTGWVSAMFEFNQMGANASVQGSVMQTSALAQLTDIFQAADNSAQQPNLLFLYAVARATATIVPSNLGIAPNGGSSSWSTSVQGQAGVQGLSMDFYWGSGLCCGRECLPQASGLLSSAVASVAIAAWLNSTASNAQNGVGNSFGERGILVPSQYQGMIGG